MSYNSQLNNLVLPEYGRNVQRMVEYALTIEDRQKRTQCAYSIVKFMGNLLPHLRDDYELKHKLWDHLVIMSDFKLDIDFPYEVITQQELYARPDVLPYTQGYIRYRLYGRLLEELVFQARNMPYGSPEQCQLLMHVATRMKFLRLEMKSSTNADDEKIFKDLQDYFQDELPFSTRGLVLNYATNSNTSKKNHQSNGRKSKKGGSRSGR